MIPDHIQRSGFVSGFERVSLFTLDEVFRDMKTEPTKAIFDGFEVSLGIMRHQCFKISQTCARCGVVGTYFALERSAKLVDRREKVWVSAPQSQWVLNLYASREDGSEVMLTQDHVIPKSVGGPDTLDNSQTMCSPCNGWKGNKLIGRLTAKS